MEVYLDKDVSEKIIGSAIEVDSIPGPGLLESTYESCLAYEMTQRGIQFSQQLLILTVYNGGIRRFVI